MSEAGNFDELIKSPKNANMSLRAKRGNPWPRAGNESLDSKVKSCESPRTLTFSAMSRQGGLITP